MSENNFYRNDDRKKKIGLLVLAVVVLIILILSLLRSCSGGTEEQHDYGGIVYDSEAVEGGWEQTDEEGIINTLNEQVQEGEINISMNTAPVFENGTAKGNLMIVNEGINRYPQVVEIRRNDTGELLYASNAIPVGSKIEKARLMGDLPAGSYECTAMFISVDPVSGKSLGSAGALITITVKS